MQDSKPRQRAKERACDRAILDTLAYYAVFKYPVGIFQLYTALITKEVFEYDFFKKSLRRLIKARHVKADNDLFYLSKIKPVSHAVRVKNALQLQKLTREYIPFFEMVPWIKLVGITGSVANLNADKESDIDIFIIAQKGRVWLTRGFVSIIFSILGKYAKGTNNKNKFCLNLFVDEANMEWPKDRQSLFIAHEILFMQPVLDKDNCYRRFLEKNVWAFSNYKNMKFTFAEARAKQKHLNGFIGNFLEKCARYLQMLYMRNKRTTEIVTSGKIHFNKHDHTSKILETYRKIVENNPKIS